MNIAIPVCVGIAVGSLLIFVFSIFTYNSSSNSPLAPSNSTLPNGNLTTMTDAELIERAHQSYEVRLFLAKYPDAKVLVDRIYLEGSRTLHLPESSFVAVQFDALKPIPNVQGYYWDFSLNIWQNIHNGKIGQPTISCGVESPGENPSSDAGIPQRNLTIDQNKVAEFIQSEKCFS